MKNRDIRIWPIVSEIVVVFKTTQNKDEREEDYETNTDKHQLPVTLQSSDTHIL
jgi:hypothetical protein